MESQRHEKQRRGVVLFHRTHECRVSIGRGKKIQKASSVISPLHRRNAWKRNRLERKLVKCGKRYSKTRSVSSRVSRLTCFSQNVHPPREHKDMSPIIFGFTASVCQSRAARLVRVNGFGSAPALPCAPDRALARPRHGTGLGRV